MKSTLIVLLVALSFFGSVRVTTSQVPLPWYLQVSPDAVSTRVPQCWATFTVSVTGSTDSNIRLIFNWLSPVSSSNLHYDETFSTVGHKAPFKFDVVVEGFPGLATAYTLEVSAHADITDNRNWFDYSLRGLNQKVTVTVYTSSQYPPGSCGHYTLATTHATTTYTTIDMRSPTTAYTQTSSFSVTGAAEKPPQPFWEQIPPIVLLAAILAPVVVVGVHLRHRTTEKRTQPATTARFCTKCGNAIPEGSGFCTSCGEKLG